MWTLTRYGLSSAALGEALQESLIAALGSVPRSEHLGQRAGVPGREALAPCCSPPAILGGPPHNPRAGPVGCLLL